MPRHLSSVDQVIGTMLIHCRVIAVADTLPIRHRRHKQRAKDLRLVGAFEQRWDRDELVAATSHDPVLSILLLWRTRPNWAEVSPLCLELKYYWQMWDQWRQDDQGLLWYRWMESRDIITQWKLMILHCFRAEQFT